MKAVTFADRVTVQVHAGDGGNGCASFRREKYIPRGGPDGGDGGHGGSVYLRASHDTDSLINLFYQPIQRAKHGGPGRGKQCTGRNADDLYIRVPCGTEARLDTGEFVGEVVEEGQAVMIARGGKGGLGNMRFTTSTHRAPTKCTPGEDGEHKVVVLELKTVADVGLVGYPNAGKSTLLRAISPARPKVAAYPFTTLHPVIGTVVFEDFRGLKVADIPGLIDGAHEGVGLGHDFLRHIVRTKFLLFVLDMAGVDGRNPTDDFRSLKNELKHYDKDLPKRASLVVANKMDLPESKKFLSEFKRKTRLKPLEVSAATGDGIEEVKKRLHALAKDE
jgi:GTPase